MSFFDLWLDCIFLFSCEVGYIFRIVDCIFEVGWSIVRVGIGVFWRLEVNFGIVEDVVIWDFVICVDVIKGWVVISNDCYLFFDEFVFFYMVEVFVIMKGLKCSIYGI